MTTSTSSNPTHGRTGHSTRRRKRFPSISGIHLLIIAAGVLALIANLALLRGGETPLTRMAVSRADLPPGRNLRADDIELVSMDVPEPVASGLISENELAEYRGWIVTTRTASGSLLSKADLRAPLTTSGFRAMSFPVDVEHATGGDLVPGDLVDVIRVDEEKASFVATGVPVLDVPGQSEGALGLSDSFFLVLEVDDRTALILALALANAEVEVLRSTGASSPTVRVLLEEGTLSGELPAPLSADDPVLPGVPASGVSPPIEGGLLP